MRNLLIIFGLLVSLTSSGQFNLSSGFTIQISCGMTGVTSNDIANIQRLVHSRSHDSLRQSLYSFSAAEAVLSVIALQTLESKGTIVLTAEEGKRIKDIAAWTDRFSICYACSQHMEGTVADLLSRKGSPAYQLLAAALFKSA